MRSVVVFLLATFAALALWSARSQACSCLGVATVVPAPGSVDIPRDAKIWIGVQRRLDAQSIVVVDTFGSPIAGRWSSLIGGHELAVFHPAAPLAANMSYRVVGETGELSTFTTSALFSAPPPEIGLITIDAIIVDEASSCSINDAENTVVVVVNVENNGAFVVADVDGDASLNVREAPQQYVAGSVTALSDTSAVAFGKHSCVAEWPRAAPNVSGTARVGVLDIAGNFSGWSEEFVIDVPSAPDIRRVDPEQQGCAAMPAESAIVALIALIARRHRRTR